MTHFNNIKDLQQAKLRYRILAKQMHPDKGGSAIQFQEMQKEYRSLLFTLQNKQLVDNEDNEDNDTSEILNELSKLAMELIKKQVPQNLLKHRIKKSQSPLEKGLLFGLVNILNKI